ncbi:MAG: TrkA family potassium uptake protein [Chloroflexi bacterium CG_4_9_14_3_um_filter_45_9]|nr:MAG: potassium transporter TrkA [Dehalococcoidia bacterium CG2_30_46_9]PIU23382.1 MAG: TrkA family potassium uptake protein [Chloroflexi bacterium CG08_land_8_20_14_0_20_45_12]PIX27798.1 MAG: TrkA family potassium uptake protein [Chloroflexi bacterium CG_4_8_14_3_um_filter_45_15]PJB51006.1 MAG: TrkA family potassium uptake protein [Chloroflexi bacterium CG_4_9_14_3_um_filter_45_9]
MNIIIMGCGRVGSELAKLLDAEGHKVTIMDIEANSFDTLPSDFGGVAFLGDATDEEMLKKAGIAQANAFIAVTSDDDKNAMAAQIAKQIFNVPKVLCRMHDPLRAEFFESLGLEAISPIFLFVQVVREKLGIGKEGPCIS